MIERMSRTRLGAAAAGIAAAVALSACSASVGGAPVGDPAATSATVAVPSGESAADTVWSAIPEVEAAAAPKRSVITQTLPDGATVTCTAGPAVAAEAARGHLGYVAAAHCDKGPGTVTVGSESTAPYTGTIAGTYGATVTWGASNATATVVGGHRKVRGVLTPEATRGLAFHTPVCVDGAVSGARCGLLVDADGEGIEAKVDTVAGDSGSPMFLVGERGVVLIGLVEESATPYTHAAHLAPLFDKLGAVALVDEATAVDTKSNPGYSHSVTTVQ
ncbi:hypothetical protein AWC21_12460 [Mycolicibacterium peregrinum]|nr:hypothetical protein AWC21_12460 [Mycolicibacterium peregrinum]